MLKKVGVAFLFIFLIGLVAGGLWLNDRIQKQPIDISPKGDTANTIASNMQNPIQLQKFSSADELKTYLEESQKLNNNSSGFGTQMRTTGAEMMVETNSVGDMAKSALTNESSPSSDGSGSASPDRVSETNVQVAGIDEPDIVKADGNSIYVSTENQFYYGGFVEPMLMETNVMIDKKVSAGSAGSEAILLQEIPNKTKIINAFPPESMKKVSEYAEAGNLLIEGNTLMILRNDGVTGIDVSDKANPKEKWTFKYGDGFMLNTAREYNGELYLILTSYIDYSIPCPYKPIVRKESALEIACTDIYRPSTPMSIDSNYNVIKVNPDNGEIITNISFVGSNNSSAVYISRNAIYLTYIKYMDEFDFMVGFIEGLGSAEFGDEVMTKVNNLKQYDISKEAKMVELQSISNKYIETKLGQDPVNNERYQKLAMEYYQKLQRDIEKTSIVKIDVRDLSIQKTGDVPGHLLNQFSMDEFNDNLRVATTMGDSWRFGISNDLSINDVYILNSDMSIVGSVKDLGAGEQIYSARFIEDKGYVVTFKQTDPFYILDLSNPSSPSKTGELKIPGYSSYLHPFEENLILGVGSEENNVKLSLFDVSDPKSPTEVSKLSLDNTYWSDVSQTHHAFLQDAKHKVFFMPAGDDGYVYSYEKNEIKEAIKIPDIFAKRAIFMGDYMYVVGEKEIFVLNEIDWSIAKKLPL